jgi:dTDP-glucose pyrophosphorylase
VLRQAVVLVGGLGTRLGPLTQATPKPLLPVAGEPFLDILLRNIARHGFEDILLLARHHADQIRARYATGRIAGATVRVFEERERAGTAGALREVAAELDARFLLSNGDSYFDINYLALAAGFSETQAAMVLALREVPDAGRYGQVTLAPDGRVTRFAEKTGLTGQPGLINGGVYVVSRDVLAGIGPGEVSLETDVMPALATQGRLVGLPFEGYFLDIGIPETYAQAQVDLPRQVRRKAVFVHFGRGSPEGEGADAAWLARAAGAIRRVNDAGRLVIVIDPAPDGGRDRHLQMNQSLQGAGAHVDAVHLYAAPLAALVAAAATDWNIDLAGSAFIGSDPQDLDAARAAGLRAHGTAGADLAPALMEVDL